MSEADIRLNVARNVASVTLARAPVNALTPAMFGRLREIFHQIAQDTSVRAAILSAEGKTFCAGSDVKGFLGQTPAEAEVELAGFRLTFNALQDCPVPVIAAINGPAIGAGLVLAALCDIRLASAKAWFSLPEITVGGMGGARHIMRIASQGTARLMAFTGCRIEADEALRAGIVERVVPHEALGEAAMEMALQIASRSPPAMRLAKQAANRVETMSLKEGYEYECELIASLRDLPESREASMAFLEKRRPDFDSLR